MSYKKQTVKTVIIFDFDGVLVDSFDIVWRILKKLHGKYNLPAFEKEDDVRKLYEKNFYVSLKELGLSVKSSLQLKEDIKRQSEFYQKHVVPFRGIPQLVIDLSKKHDVFIVSSNFREFIERFLEKYGMERSVNGIFGVMEGTGKVEKIKKIINKYTCKETKIFYIGDTVGDIIEGRAAGVITAAVIWGYHDKTRLLKIFPDYLFDSISELREFFLKDK